MENPIKLGGGSSVEKLCGFLFLCFAMNIHLLMYFSYRLYSSSDMESRNEQYTLKELQEIKDWMDQHGVNLSKFKKAELPTIEICKDVGHFNGEAWLADDIQAGWSFCGTLGDGKALPYVASMLQWGRVYGKETSFVGHYSMLRKVFVAADTPREHSKAAWLP